MALFLGGMLLHGVAPGPDMIAKKLDLTYMMVWAIVLANVIGGLVAFALAGQLARVVFVRAAILVPIISSVVVIGGVQSSRQWEDLLFLLLVGAIGWVMKHARWSRAPMFLAFILTPLIERYFHISTNLHGAQWAAKPAVAVMLAITALFLLGVAAGHVRKSLRRRVRGSRRFQPTWNLDVAFTLSVLLAAGAGYWSSVTWPYDARLLPQVTCAFTGVTAAAVLFMAWWVPVEPPRAQPAGADDDMHYDLVTDFGGLTPREIVLRALKYLGLLVVFGLLGWMIGILAALPVYILAAMRQQGESWRMSLSVALGTGVVVYVLFRRVLDLAWPPALWPLL